MSPFIILSTIVILYLCSQPRLRRYIERDGVYLSRNWTSFVNAIFITLVTCSHGLILFQTSIRDYFPERVAAGVVAQFGQLMVTTFFFFSGYGIMYSLLNRGGYCNKLLFPRFFQLSLNFIIAVMAYFIIHCLLQQEIDFRDFLEGLHSFSSLGNPTWFVLMTLLTYILTYISFKLCGTKSPGTALSLLTGALIIAIYLISMIKPGHWVNTLLCFPAGMWYYQKGEQVENILKKTKLPGIIYALLLIYAGKQVYSSGIQPYHIYVQNAGSILFALGVTWLAGCFTWKRPSRILIWLGGSGLFAVYMFHLLPMRILTHLELNQGNPYFVWFCVIALTSAFVWAIGMLYTKINLLLFSKQ